MRRHVFTAALVFLGAGCGLFAGQRSERPFCASDAECGGDQVCFPDGCGDPGRDIAVEIVPGATSGQLAQDFRIDKLQPVQNIQGFEPAVVTGLIHQATQLNEGVFPYLGNVTFRAWGESLVIPGRKRSVQYTISPDQGAYEVAMPTGVFTVNVSTPQDRAIPPQRIVEPSDACPDVEIESGVVVCPGQRVGVNVLFPHQSHVITVSGKLYLEAATATTITAAAMEVQAFDPETGAALSQRAPVYDNGSFVLSIEPRLVLERLIIRAAPKDPSVLVPTKDFDVAREAQLSAPLEMGNFGSPLQLVGKLVDKPGDDGQALVGATIYAEGFARGGGTFRTPAIATGWDGVFTLNVLKPAYGSALTLWAIPTETSASGILRAEYDTNHGGLDLGKVVAPRKVEVKGKLLRPDNKVASGVTIEAEPIDAVPGRPMPHRITRAVSDTEGRFTLRLDPAEYRLDCIPSDLLPRVSRLITVPADDDGSGNLKAVELPDFQLSRGRRVTGSVTSIPRLRQAPMPAPYASVKFFRILDIEGKSSSVLLAETVADEAGSYSVLLPTR